MIIYDQWDIDDGKKRVAISDFNDINFSKWNKYKSCLKNVMGMKNATLMIKTTTKISDMKKNASLLIKNLEFDSFRISTKRHYKKSDYDSQQINALIGEYIQKKTNKEVNLSNTLFR